MIGFPEKEVLKGKKMYEKGKRLVTSIFPFFHNAVSYFNDKFFKSRNFDFPLQMVSIWNHLRFYNMVKSSLHWGISRMIFNSIPVNKMFWELEFFVDHKILKDQHFLVLSLRKINQLSLYHTILSLTNTWKHWLVDCMVLNTIFNIISVISWQLSMLSWFFNPFPSVKF